MFKEITIALDAMGGDYGPSVVIPAALSALTEFNDLKVILVGDQQILADQLQSNKVEVGSRLSIRHASQVVGMDEVPSKALRFKKDSSMRVAISLVKEGEANACVSAGNTGALMATARFVLKTMPNVDRPALINPIPSIEGCTHVLDLGANVDCTVEHLFQFAVMGSLLVSAVHDISHPRVGLLNVGQEETKGNEIVKNVALLLKASSLNYVGFVEGDAIYTGGVDVVVCDGFVGNVALKSSEGAAKMISHSMRQEFHSNWLSRLAGLMVLPVIKAFSLRIDPRRYNGASLLGLQGTVIKSHGGADALAFANAIKIAMLEVKQEVPKRINSEIGSLLRDRAY